MGAHAFILNVKSLENYNIFIFVMILYVYVTDAKKPITKLLIVRYNETLHTLFVCHLWNVNLD